MLYLPEIRLQRFCSALFAYLVNNYNTFVEAGKENESHLYLLFHQDTINHPDAPGIQGEENYYAQAKEIFTRSREDTRALLVRPIFDRTRATLPTVHVVIPQDMQDMSFLGDVHGQLYSNGDEKIERGFRSSFSFLVTSDNIMEVNIISNVLRALLLSAPQSLQAIGLINPRLSMQEVNLGPDVVPANTYVRGIFLDSAYTEIVPPIKLKDQVDIMNIYFKMDCSGCTDGTCGL